MRNQTDGVPATRPGVPFLGALVLSLLTAAAACAGSEPESTAGDTIRRNPLPMAIHEMPLLEITAGQDAEALIRRLHGKEVAPLASYLGEYKGGGTEATLYVSQVRDAALADSLVDRMAQSIGSGNQTFAHHTRFKIDDLAIHAVLGQGQAHFFFSRGSDVIWLGIDRSMARVGLADLLGLGPERVPTGIVLDGVDLLPPPDSLYRRQHPDGVTSGQRR